jgi:hypothetical protein
MRYATALVAALALGAAASVYTPKADAGVVVGVGLPVPGIAPAVVAGPGPYYPYAGGPVVGFGVRCCGPFYGHPYYGPGYRGIGYYHPGIVHGGYSHGGFAHGYRR